MSSTDRYREQHAQILQLAGELSAQLDPSRLATDAAQARKTLSSLSGKTFVHLAAEDRLLYPELSNSRDVAVQELGRRFLKDMGPLSQAFKDYSMQWGTRDAIQSAPDAFVRATKAILKVLAQRIQREEVELYPVAEKV